MIKAGEWLDAEEELRKAYMPFTRLPSRKGWMVGPEIKLQSLAEVRSFVARHYRPRREGRTGVICYDQQPYRFQMELWSDLIDSVVRWAVVCRGKHGGWAVITSRDPRRMEIPDTWHDDRWEAFTVAYEWLIYGR